MLLDEKQKHYANKFQIHLEASYEFTENCQKKVMQWLDANI